MRMGGRSFHDQPPFEEFLRQAWSRYCSNPKANTAVTITLLHLLANHLHQQWQAAVTEVDHFCLLCNAVILNLSFFGSLHKSDAAAIMQSNIQTDCFHCYILATIPQSKTD